MTMCPVEAESFHTDGWMDGRTVEPTRRS